MPLKSKLINGDINAFESVYRLHFQKVYSVVKKYIKNDTAVDDITQDVFLKLWLYRNKITKDLPIEQQLFTITKNIVFNHFRKKLNEKKLLSTYQILNTVENNNEDNHSSKQLKEIQLLIKKLPKKQRTVFKMYRFEGLTYQEIAISLNISKNTVSNHLNTAMNFIKKNVSSFFLML